MQLICCMCLVWKTSCVHIRFLHCALACMALCVNRYSAHGRNKCTFKIWSETSYDAMFRDAPFSMLNRSVVQAVVGWRLTFDHWRGGVLNHCAIWCFATYFRNVHFLFPQAEYMLMHDTTQASAQYNNLMCTHDVFKRSTCSTSVASETWWWTRPKPSAQILWCSFPTQAGRADLENPIVTRHNIQHFTRTKRMRGRSCILYTILRWKLAAWHRW